jgi:hypothetical protein
VADDLYCVKHAEREQLVAATGVDAGRSSCGVHGGSSAATTAASLAKNCVDCRSTQHRAYFVVDQQPLCVRHAADAVFADDDMGAHDMAHAAYIQLKEIGVQDAY